MSAMDARDLISVIAPPTGGIGAAYYFDPATLARGKELGLDGFRFYLLGRGGVLGDVESEVIHSAFGYFHPAMVKRLWDSGREVMAPRDVAREYLACAHGFARDRLGGVEGLGAYRQAATAVIDAVDDAAYALFAGLRAEPVPGDDAAAAYHQAVILRELRGCAHLVAVVAKGVPAPVAHAIKRPDAVAMFGWDEAPTVTDDHRRRLAEAEELTDELLIPAFSVLDTAGAEALAAGTRAMAAAIGL